jgi:hypothetical protein
VVFRRRFWAELGFGAFSALALVLTAAWPDWIEAALGVDPDGGDGSLEWGIVGLLALCAVITPLLARREWRRSRGAPRPASRSPA